ncbi:hypothetical protein HFP71_03895 [Streptomyces sp. ARC32]
MSHSLTPRDKGNLPALNAAPLVRLDAYVAEDGSTVVNGHLLEMGGMRQPNEAILDAVAMFARTLGAPVAATVIDRTAQQVARLRVHPDGSSRTIAEEDDLPPGRERTAAEEAAFPPLARVERIIQHAQREELHAAFVLASALREHLTLRRGAEDELSLEARAIEAYLAYLRGDHMLSTVLALTVARIRCRTDLDRAAPTWPAPPRRGNGCGTRARWPPGGRNCSTCGNGCPRRACCTNRPTTPWPRPYGAGSHKATAPCRRSPRPRQRQRH